MRVSGIPDENRTSTGRLRWPSRLHSRSISFLIGKIRGTTWYPKGLASGSRTCLHISCND